MKTLKNWMLASQHADRIELLVDERHLFCLYVLENNLFRVLIKPSTKVGGNQNRRSYRARNTRRMALRALASRRGRRARKGGHGEALERSRFDPCDLCGLCVRGAGPEHHSDPAEKSGGDTPALRILSDTARARFAKRHTKVS